jgi:hypothetical protein
VPEPSNDLTPDPSRCAEEHLVNALNLTLAILVVWSSTCIDKRRTP